MKIEDLKTVIQSTNLNFLIGSGCSVPYLGALGNIENLLTELNQQSISLDHKEIIRATILKNYFTISIEKNLNLIDSSPDPGRDLVSSKYQELLRSLYSILLYRKSSLLPKQVNLFTTNMDLFIEANAEELGIELSDGFKGRIMPKFDLTTFKKVFYKRSQQFDLKSEVPTVNCYKLHGSVNWKVDEEEILLDIALSNLQVIRSKVLSTGVDIVELFTSHGEIKKIEDLINEVCGMSLTPEAEDFLLAYDLLPIINPTKEKFKETTLNYTHYELIRILSNELEKENSVLFVLGFSFADEHLREVVLRAANSNPTLKVLIFAYRSVDEQDIESGLSLRDGKNIYGNISFVARDNEGTPDEELYDLSVVNKKYFSEIAKELHSNFK